MFSLLSLEVSVIETSSSRERIVLAAWELLQEAQDASAVTVRRVAERAGVGIGLINYHFTSKDLLLMEAAAQAMAQRAENWIAATKKPGKDAMSTLKQMLTDLTDMGSEHTYLMLMAARMELAGGEVTSPLYILPLVQQITGLDDVAARLVAFSLISALQSAVLRTGPFRDFTGFDLSEKGGRDSAISCLVDAVLRPAEEV